VVPLDRVDAVIGASERAIAAGARIYWICPLVEDSEHAELSSAEARFADLEARFPGRVGLVHGRLGSDAKEAALSDFAAGRTAILVATTVVEVGVDVPAASVMVIEHAERFGLAQLHQLRGRVGRGAAQSRCLLLYAAPLGPTAEARLRILRETEDGFRIAEEDLRLRGSGDLLGSAQSGMPGFRIARLGAHAGLLATARDDARLILQRDPDLTSERGQALRLLLHLFERHEAVGLLRAG
jgi:ATP-dependent DNA helicase RecG